jgi:fatty-acyl-CoA synthase
MMDTPESSPLAACFAELAQTCGAQRAMTFRGDERHPGHTLAYDFAKFWRRVARVTAHLQAIWQIQPGDRVAWLGLNHELQLVTLVACARLGAIFMPLNFRLAVVELQQVLDDAQPRLLVHDGQHAPVADALTGATLRRTRLDALIEAPSPRGLSLPAVSGDAPVLLVYTSGTTGQPKGAVHTQNNLLANARASQAAHGFVAGDLVLSTLPLFHVGGLCIQTLPALLAGVAVVLHARFDAGAWIEEVEHSHPSLSLLVPATLRAVLDHPRWASAQLSSLRGVMAGSSTIPVAYLQAFHDRGIPVGQIYGTTETGPVSIVLPLDQAVARLGSAGWPHAEAQVALRNEHGERVPVGETGEVCIHAPNVMRGYWQADGAAGVGLQAGWFCTGDLGQQAEDGCITIVGRSKDMVISGGENIYPAEIENLLVSLPGVAECAVVGLPDARWGEVPVAVLVRSADAAGQGLTSEAVMQHLHSRIARFKWPRQLVWQDQLPKSALGKVQKPLLRAQLIGINP